jgi:hypothetical protein
MIDSSNNKTSYLVSSQLPEFVRRDHPLFVQFLESYYKFLEQGDNLMYLTKRFPDFYDIDTLNQRIADLTIPVTTDMEVISVDSEVITVDQTLEKIPPYYEPLYNQFFTNFAKFIPSNMLADPVTVLKHSKDFYRSRGSEKSIRFLARVLFNKEATVYYPQTNILKPSDGKWFVQKSINIQNVTVDNVANSIAFSRFVNTSITGGTSNSTCTVESVNPYYQSGILVTELIVSDVVKDFYDGETITTTIEDQGVYKTLSASIYSGIITSTTVTSPGSGYVEGASVTIRSTDQNGYVVSNGNIQFGFGGQVVINKVTKSHLEGKIKQVNVLAPGAGYIANTPLLFTGGDGANAAGNVFSVQDTYVYHPAYYNIVGSTISDVAGYPIVNAVGDYVETQAYSNLATQWSNTSNLDISTPPGSIITTLWLSKNMANSNVYFETGDVLSFPGTAYANQTITLSNKQYWQITTTPGLPGSLANVSFVVNKKPNVNTLLANSMNYWTYGPCGPIIACDIINTGSGYTSIPSVSVLSNTSVRSLGMLGRMDIINGGQGYANGDIITFDNPYGTYGYGGNAQVSVVDSNGTIVQVNFFALPGYPPGGLGYREDALPTANIHTVHGNGAIIQVSACIADGASLNAQSNVIGSIASLKIISGGLGYHHPPIIDLSTQGDGTAQAYANIVTGIYTYPGRYLDQAGQPSSPYKLQDRDYYQNYSYVIQISESINNYRKALYDLVHPAGLKVYGEYLHEDNNQSRANGINVINTSIQAGVRTSSLIVSLDSAQYLTITSNTTAYNNIWFNTANTKQWANIANGASVVGSGMKFDGNNDTVIMPHQSSLNVSNLITVIAWFDVANTANTGRSIVAKTDNGYTRGFDLYNYGKNLEVIVRPTTATNKLLIANNINSNTWVMGAFTYDGSTIRGYINGNVTNISIGTANSATDSNGSIYIGGRYAANANVANVMAGKIGLVQIYNRVLSNSEIINSFSLYRGRFGV